MIIIVALITPNHCHVDISKCKNNITFEEFFIFNSFLKYNDNDDNVKNNIISLVTGLIMTVQK